ncbi:hydroxyacid dehydrogenase [Flavobacterium rivuli WB 3.3-2 = DSM 21788]|uniref:Glyoxylate/hydroxypyruvate reductase B n=1 Tax=Flavobacterium rivuli WB 3.3-2 = DSM 21788 TaxID=1121895 RepID=A0A0A2M150_9FLAO|nr:D-glycerate dehydrogenase [Flavobacterium rivuli]KGO85336.1 hydroxyacid dehydrogenase [Flavobacterium rivuli WB 3.3-2 = DSM 21788]
MKVFTTRKMPQAGIDLLEAEGYKVTQWSEDRELTQEELIDDCKVADGILLSGRRKVDTAFLEACSHLKVISLFSVGYDNVDVAAATKFKIPIGHTPDVLSKATADTAFLLLLATSRKAFYHHKRIAKGDWDFFSPTADLGIDIHGKTLGVLGLGNIGYEMAKLCKSAYGMNIIYHNRSNNEQAEKELDAKKVSFEELLQQSDVLSVHANLTDELKGIFNKEAFAKTKPNAIFINTARGGIHNEADLREALENGTIWGAGLDVTNPEPMDKNNPLLDMPNVSVLPHIGSAVQETRDAMAVLAAKNVIAAFKGEKLVKCVNPEVYDK